MEITEEERRAKSWLDAHIQSFGIDAGLTLPEIIKRISELPPQPFSRFGNMILPDLPGNATYYIPDHFRLKLPGSNRDTVDLLLEAFSIREPSLKEQDYQLEQATSVELGQLTRKIFSEAAPLVINDEFTKHSEVVAVKVNNGCYKMIKMQRQLYNFLFHLSKAAVDGKGMSATDFSIIKDSNGKDIFSESNLNSTMSNVRKKLRDALGVLRYYVDLWLPEADGNLYKLCLGATQIKFLCNSDFLRLNQGRAKKRLKRSTLN